MKKIGQKTVSVLEACGDSGNSGGEGDQPLATMLYIYSSPENSSEFIISYSSPGEVFQDVPAAYLRCKAYR